MFISKLRPIVHLGIYDMPFWFCSNTCCITYIFFYG